MDASHAGPLTGLASYIFPNDYHVHWSLMIVLYPYISGLIAGSFIIFALYHIFKIKDFKPVANYALMFSLAFTAIMGLPVINHLGRPDRAINMMITPSPTSAMAGGGFLFNIYGLILTLIILLYFRPVLVELKNAAQGIFRPLYGLLSLGSDNLSEKSLNLDRKIIRILVLIGIPLASILTSYVGFIFGGTKANPLWTTPLMPVIFLLSACVSGLSGIILTYSLIKLIKGEEPDEAFLRTGTKFLWGFFIFAFAFEMLEFVSHAYLAKHHWETLESLFWGPLYESYWVAQVMIFSVPPFILLGILSLVRVKAGVLKIVTPLCSLMLLVQVFLMRWNVVIGGQLMSKSERGSVYYHPEWLEKEGLLPAIIIMLLPFAILFILSRIFPFWEDRIKPGIEAPDSNPGA